MSLGLKITRMELTKQQEIIKIGLETFNISISSLIYDRKTSLVHHSSTINLMRV